MRLTYKTNKMMAFTCPHLMTPSPEKSIEMEFKVLHAFGNVQMGMSTGTCCQ